MPIETYKCLIFQGWWSVWMDGLQIRITRIVIGRLSKQQQDIRRGHSLTPQTFALLPEMSCCCFEIRPMTMQRVIRIWRPSIHTDHKPRKIRHL
jgi:hypothetical protein